MKFFVIFTLVLAGTCFDVSAAPRRPSQPQCLKLLDHYQTSPINLTGKLAVTYVDQEIEKMKAELEKKKDPRAEKIDSHELGVLDLTRPNDGIRRLSNDLIHQAEVEVSPDGSKFLYTQREKLDDFENHSEFWQVNMDGTSKTKLMGGQPIGVPAWIYPKGEEFIFINWGTESGDSKLWTFNMLSKVVKAFPGNLAGPADPEVSYDGKLITFKMMVEGERNQQNAENQPSIYVMNINGSGIKRLTGLQKSARFSDHDPVFSKDGSKIYFERYYGPGDWFEASQDRGGDPRHNWWGIVEVDVATAKEKIIAAHDPCGKHFYWLPTVSPDGKYVMYAHVEVWAEKEGRPWTDVWVSEIDGKNPQKVRGSDWVYFFDWTK